MILSLIWFSLKCSYFLFNSTQVADWLGKIKWSITENISSRFGSYLEKNFRVLLVRRPLQGIADIPGILAGGGVIKGPAVHCVGPAGRFGIFRVESSQPTRRKDMRSSYAVAGAALTPNQSDSFFFFFFPGLPFFHIFLSKVSVKIREALLLKRAVLSSDVLVAAVAMKREGAEEGAGVAKGPCLRTSWAQKNVAKVLPKDLLEGS